MLSFHHVRSVSSVHSERRHRITTAALAWAVLGLAALTPFGCSSSKTTPAPQPDSPARPELTNVYQVAPVVDVLARIEPQRDAVNGQFRMEDGSLVVPAVRSSQLNVSVDLPEQYEMVLEVAKTQGNESLNLGFTMGVHQAVIVLEGWGGETSALNMVDGQLGEDNVTSSQFEVFPSNQPRQIRVIVRKESVLVDVDGGVFIDYRGAPSRLSFDERYFRRPRLDQLMIGSWETEYRISKWTLTPLGDERVDWARNPQLADAGSDPTPPTKVPSTNLLGAADDPTPPTSDPAVPLADKTPDKTPDPDPATATQDPEPVEPEPVTEPPVVREQVAWRAEPDPFPGWDGSAAAQMSIPVPDGFVSVPRAPSPYFMIGHRDEKVLHWTLYDVRQGEAVGNPCETPGSSDYYDFRLSPTGRYLQAHHGQAHSRKVVVYSFESGKQVYDGASPLPEPSDALGDYLVGDHRLLQVRRDEDDVTFQRVDLRTGQAETAWRAGRRSGALETIAISPGGRYAVADWNQHYTVYDLETTETVGEFEGPEGFEPQGALAFPIDGAQLALLGAVEGRPHAFLMCVDWRTGQTALWADLEAETDRLSNTYTLGPALEWFPDNDLLLYYGRDVIDRQTGKFLFQIPSNSFWQQPRRTFGDRSVLGMMLASDPNDPPEYRSIPLDKKTLETALAVIRAGGNATDIGLPPLTIGETAGARILSSRENTEPVSIEPFERAEFPEVELPMRLVQFREYENELRRIEFADPPAATAIAHFTLNTDDRDDRRDMLVRYDLKRGKPSGSIPIRSDFRLAAVSPDGSRAVLGKFNEVDGYHRLDVVDVAKPEHVAGWKPYAEEPYMEDVSNSGQPKAENPQTATHVQFITSEQVVTVNPAGKLVCWQLPECRAIYQCENVGTPLAWSEDRRYVATGDGPRVLLLDLKDGRWAGTIEAEDPPLSILRAGFSPDNRELAVILTYQGRREFTVWNLATGTPVEQFPIPYTAVGVSGSEHSNQLHRKAGLDYRRDGYLTLDDLYLIDRTEQTVPWLYGLGHGKHAVNSPDGREWFTEFKRGDDGGQVFEFWLHALAIPSDPMLELLRTNPAIPMERPIGRSVLRTTGEEPQLTQPPSESQ